ncbi:ribosome biogenesis factor YjgA [Rhodoferax mekongensis]|uniref:Dual-action ribosomal maturation protein DarP n=1 Tax=Rhodoferax mekongensis TaxID=3068341 RepID=A0ABZ0AXI9_9BURK|nr:ribosome biogenesis factor YjgA [Rhodoferax sp. TBRC 17307]WNO04356.1 ribosome biogenesis factor YjgA [Rhodoferax sp. TBRC 17307]
MSRKLKKGYYVRGLFVAEGSALDLEYKRELKGTDEPTRTDLKKESDALQKLGEDLLTLRADLMTKLELPDRLVEGVAEAKRITNFEGKRRQMQFIGKLMRKLDPAKWDEIRAALEEQHMPSVQETMVLHQAEQWRDRLIADDDAVGQWLNISPDTDSQQLRALVRQARKDAKPEKPGEAVRHGRSYREIFQLVREALLANQEASQSAASDNDIEDGDED